MLKNKREMLEEYLRESVIITLDVLKNNISRGSIPLSKVINSIG